MCHKHGWRFELAEFGACILLKYLQNKENLQRKRGWGLLVLCNVVEAMTVLDDDFSGVGVLSYSGRVSAGLGLVC